MWRVLPTPGLSHFERRAWKRKCVPKGEKKEAQGFVEVGEITDPLPQGTLSPDNTHMHVVRGAFQTTLKAIV